MLSQKQFCEVYNRVWKRCNFSGKYVFAKRLFECDFKYTRCEKK